MSIAFLILHIKCYQLLWRLRREDHRFQGLLGLQNEFKASLGSLKGLCLKIKNKERVGLYLSRRALASTPGTAGKRGGGGGGRREGRKLETHV